MNNVNQSIPITVVVVIIIRPHRSIS